MRWQESYTPTPDYTVCHPSGNFFFLIIRTWSSSPLAKAPTLFKITGTKTTVLTLCIGSKCKITVNLHMCSALPFLCEPNNVTRLQQILPEIAGSSDFQAKTGIEKSSMSPHPTPSPQAAPNPNPPELRRLCPFLKNPQEWTFYNFSWVPISTSNNDRC